MADQWCTRQHNWAQPGGVGLSPFDSQNTHWLSSSPCPSRPSLPQPHVNTTPSLVTTATWAGPQLTHVTSKLSNASISLGLDELDQSPCPKHPCSPIPQVMTMPLSVTNTVKSPPQHTLKRTRRQIRWLRKLYSMDAIEYVIVTCKGFPIHRHS